MTLLGDAAHAMSPREGSGGDVAILNAVYLAQTIEYSGITQESIVGFECAMTKRVNEKIQHSLGGVQNFGKGKEWFNYQDVDKRIDWKVSIAKHTYLQLP